MDFLEQKRAEIRERMDMLRPAVDEYDQLSRVMKALGYAVDSDSDPAEPAPEKPRRQQAKRGENKAKVFSVLTDRPGATVGEIESMSGVQKQMIYNITREAVKQGQLEKVELPSGVTGFRFASPINLNVQTPGVPAVKAGAEPVYVTQEG